ncbi:helix-turn-helix transcriptional regulator [Dryocola sp. LX212]
MATTKNDVYIYIVTDNIFFVNGFRSLLERTNKSDALNFTCESADYSISSVHYISKEINERGSSSHAVIIADNDMLGAIGLSIVKKDNVIFMDLASCKHDFIEVIADKKLHGLYTRSLQLINGKQMQIQSLTRKEKRVCYYIAKGYPSKFIGLNLGINVKSVSAYIRNIMRKIGCDNKIEFYKFLMIYYKQAAPATLCNEKM